MWRHPPYGKWWMIGHASVCARRQRQVGWWSLIEAVQWRNYSGRKSGPSALLAHFWQSTPFKMAYHSPYKAPPHINAPPDQGFLWNIFQRWVAERGGLSRCCAPAAHSAPQWKLLSLEARRGTEWGWVLVFFFLTAFSSLLLHFKLFLGYGSAPQWK